MYTYYVRHKQLTHFIKQPLTQMPNVLPSSQTFPHNTKIQVQERNENVEKDLCNLF
jgi:hypothetical protein